MNRRRTIAHASLAVALLLLPGPASAQDETTPALLTVNGDATVEVEPDQAVVRMGVENQAPSAREAQSETNRVGEAILAAIEALGVGAEAIQTSQLQLQPVYETAPSNRGTQQPRVVAYRATNTVSVSLVDLTRIGPVVDAGIAAGANRIDGIELGLQDDREARRQALVAAVGDARAKAKAIAAALEVDLGRVHEVVEQGVHVPMFELRQRSIGMMAADASTPIATGQLEVTATVVIRYRIEQP